MSEEINKSDEASPEEALTGVNCEQAYTPITVMSNVIPGTQAGSFDEVKGIADTLAIDAGIASAVLASIPGNKPGEFGHLTPITLGDMVVAAQHDVGLTTRVGYDDGITSVCVFDTVNGTLRSPGMIDRGEVYRPPTQSNFELCAEINYLVGNIPDPCSEVAEAQKKIIECEWEEFIESVANKDFTQLRDDVGDMLFTVYGMAARMGYPADLDFKAICESQFSKFDKTAEDQALTCAKYKSIGVETHYEVETRGDGSHVYVTYSSKDQTGSDKKFYPAGKWLKSVNFKEPTFTPWIFNTVD